MQASNICLGTTLGSASATIVRKRITRTGIIDLTDEVPGLILYERTNTWYTTISHTLLDTDYSERMTAFAVYRGHYPLPKDAEPIYKTFLSHDVSGQTAAH